MSNTENQNCAYCGKEFSQLYVGSNGYTVKVNSTHCSRSCANKANPLKGCIIPDIGKDALKQKVIDFILKQNKYCTKEEILVEIKHSSKTLLKHGLQIKLINNELGFTKPKSIFQNIVEGYLKNIFVDVETEVEFVGLVGVTGHPLRVDFFLPEHRIAVEADGSQHKYPNHPWAKHKNGTVKEYDDIKNLFFAKNKVRLVRIPYKRNLKESDVKSLFPFEILFGQ